MAIKRVILVTGLSGAGKTIAMGMLEDMGYHTIDQLPPQLISHLIKLAYKEQDVRYEYLALATTALDLPFFIQRFKNIDADMRILYLEADDHTLLSRYKATRRMHPLLVSNSAQTLEDAIRVEREMFEDYKDKAYFSVDTSTLSEQELKQQLQKVFALSSLPVFSISFISFGYKNGIPLDADLLFDVRFLKNPYWVESLRLLSGDDQQVIDYVMSDSKTKEYCEHLLSFLDFSFKEYVKEGKNHFTVGIGCTGGQHRSVTLVNFLYDHFSTQYQCYKRHRDKRDLSV